MNEFHAIQYDNTEIENNKNIRNTEKQKIEYFRIIETKIEKYFNDIRVKFFNVKKAL